VGLIRIANYENKISPTGMPVTGTLDPGASVTVNITTACQVRNTYLVRNNSEHATAFSDLIHIISNTAITTVYGPGYCFG